MSLTGLLAGGIVVVASAALLARRLVCAASPGEMLVLSGRRRALPGGGSAGYRVVREGWAVRIPLVERVDRMSTAPFSVEPEVQNAYSEGGVPLNLCATASVRISPDEAIYPSAIERFLGRDPSEIRQVAKEVIEGHIRSLAAKRAPEAIIEDRDSFARSVSEAAAEDFGRLGLALGALSLDSVTDEVGYLDSFARAQMRGEEGEGSARPGTRG